jgi:hypothetical protein
LNQKNHLLPRLKKLAQVQDKIKQEMPWVTDEKFDAALKKIEDFKKTWADLQEQQKETPLTEKPVFKKQDVEDKMDAAFGDMRKLGRSKKPKEGKKKKEKKEKKEKKKKGKSRGEINFGEKYSIWEIVDDIIYGEDVVGNVNY